MFIDPGLILEEESPREASSLLRAEVLFWPFVAIDISPFRGVRTRTTFPASFASNYHEHLAQSPNP